MDLNTAKPLTETSNEYDWQTRCDKLSSRLGALRTRGMWTDCKLVVGSTQEQLAAHRVLLASASPVLAAMLYGPMALPDQPVHIPNIEFDIVNRLLDFIYTDNVKVDSCDVAWRLYAAAHYLNMPPVQTVCKTYLLNASREDFLTAVFQIFELAEMFDEEEIKEKSLEIMSWDAKEIFNGGVILSSVSADTFEQLFKRCDLTCMSEIELFKIAERWVIANTTHIENVEAEKRMEDATTIEGNFDITITDPKTSIRKALQHIRFLAINPEEFAVHDMTMLLTEKEILAISLNMKSNKSYMSMPEGFCTLKEPRFNIVKLEHPPIGNKWIGECRKGDILWCFKIGNAYLGLQSQPGLTMSIQAVLQDSRQEFECKAKLRISILCDLGSWLNLIEDREFKIYENGEIQFNHNLNKNEMEEHFSRSDKIISLRFEIVSRGYSLITYK